MFEGNCHGPVCSAEMFAVVQATLANGLTFSEPLHQVIKNSKDFFDQSLDEIKLLKLLQQHDPDDSKNVLRLYDFFYFKVLHRSVLLHPVVSFAPSLFVIKWLILILNPGTPVYRHRTAQAKPI
jgi:hypothetical protein